MICENKKILIKQTMAAAMIVSVLADGPAIAFETVSAELEINTPTIITIKRHAPSPMGIFGADMPKKDKFLLSIMPIFASFSGQLIGNKGVSSQYVVMTTPTYSNPAEFMRVVPQQVPVSTQSAILSYGYTDKLTAVVTASIVQKQLYALTFLGNTGGLPLGASYTGTSGFSDLTTIGIYKIYQDETHRIQINSGFAYPLSTDTEKISLLQSNATYSNERAFYSLQPGARTFDFLPGIVYAGNTDALSWGLSYRGRLPLANNPQGWRFGDLHEFNAWIGYNVLPSITSTVRVTGTTQMRIHGSDSQISGGSVPTDPNFYGGQLAEIFGGSVLDGEQLGFKGCSLALEAGIPFYQNLNGPQIRKNWQSGLSLRLKM